MSGPAVIVKRDKHPVADLRAPWKTRHRTDSDVCGRIELAYERGYQAGFEDADRAFNKRKRHTAERK